MKEKYPKVLALCAFLVGIILGSFFKFLPSGCRSPVSKEGIETDTTRTLTIDTVTHRAPVPADSSMIGAQVFKLPVKHQGAGSGGMSHCTTQNVNTPQAIDSIVHIYGTGAGGQPRQCQEDSVAVEIPITQKHYRDSTYEAWVSGFAHNLDSIRVFPRTETITIKEYKPPNRWHIGITAGYGYTPHGFQPYIGIGISYSLFSWK